MSKIQATETIHERNKRLRAAIVRNDGYIKRAAQELGMNYTTLIAAMNNKHNKTWWLRKKKEYARLRRNARDRKWYANAKIRAALHELECSAPTD